MFGKRILSLRVFALAVIALLVFSLTLSGQIVENSYKLTASDRAEGNYFGSSIALDGATFVAGSYGRDPGACYIFDFVQEQWTETGMIIGEDSLGWYNFPSAVAKSGERIIIGARQHDNEKGAAYIYRRIHNEWVLEQKLMEPDGLQWRHFGAVVDIKDDIAIVCTKYNADDPSLDPNRLYIYRLEGEIWNLIQQYEGGEGYGTDLAYDGHYLVVGEYYQAKIMVYEYDGNSFTVQDSIQGSGASFSAAVDVDGETIVAGYWGDGINGHNSGSATVYSYDGSSWQFVKKLTPGSPASNDMFGCSVDVEGDIMVIGAEELYSYGSAYVFQRNGNDWVQVERLRNAAGAQYGSFGQNVALDGGTVLVSAHADDVPYNLTGSVSVFQFVAHPGNVNVSDGEFSNRNKISWKKTTNKTVDHFTIYRDGAEIAETRAGARAYYDYDAEPGKLHKYMVTNTNSDWGESTPNHDLGWFWPDGELGGTITTPFGAAVSDVELVIRPSASEIKSSLLIEEAFDHVLIEEVQNFPGSALTFSMWLKSSDTENEGTPVSYALPEMMNAFILIDQRDFRVVINGAETGATGVSINDGEWHHIAVTWQNSDGEVNIIKDGILEFTGELGAGFTYSSGGALVFGNEQDAFAGGFAASQQFRGLMDEVRLWDHVRTADEIIASMHQPLTGKETGLVGYWNFDDPARSDFYMAGDFSKKGSKHGILKGAEYSSESDPLNQRIYTDSNGKYELENIYYGESRDFELTPLKLDHGFSPVSKLINLNRNVPINTSVDFIDTTSYTLAGVIQFEGTECTVENVAFLVNDIPEDVKTNAKGEFKLTIERAGTYRIKPVLENGDISHTFHPADTTLIVESNILDLKFRDTQKYNLTTRLRGPCDTHIGSATFRITTLGDNSGCFQQTVDTDDSGNFTILLPAQPYAIEMTNVEPFDPRIMEYFTIDTVDLTWGDQEKYFTYRQPPAIRVTGFPEKGTGAFQVPIMEQHVPYTLLIEVMDHWEEYSCYVNEGTITIYDDIAGKASKPVELTLVDGMARYTCIPGNPNILSGGDHPYQRLIQIVAHVGEENVSYEQWALVTGHSPRSQTFVATTPEIPQIILHDPPGDQSYSFMAQDSTYSVSHNHIYESAGGGGLFLDAKIGAVVGVSTGFIVSAETEMGAYVLARASFTVGAQRNTSDNLVTTYQMTREFSTSGDDAVVGEEGDVYIGASYINLYAITDVISYNWESGEVEESTSLAWQPEKIRSTFAYTESHIVHTLIPQLKELKDAAQSSGETDLELEYDASLSVWNQIVEQNKANKSLAVKKKNISFSAGTTIGESHTVQSDSTHTLEVSTFFEGELALGLGVVINGVETEAGFHGFLAFKWTDVYDTTYSTTNTYGYVLGDDDPGDFFSVDVMYNQDDEGNDVGPPVFNLIGGRSSCPWEKGSQPRDSMSIKLDKYVQYNVPPEDPATFILSLGNLSPASETREYHLAVVQESNLDGAILRVGGVVIEDHLAYSIPAGEQLKATLTVERGPIAYDYENLKLRFYAPCDAEALADTVTFSVHYISPCSDVNLLLPQDGWLVNQSDHDSLMIVINDYDKNNPHLEKILFQYRRQGEGWTTAYVHPVDEIPVDFILEHWNVSHLQNGTYQLRAVSDCGTKGTRYSDISSGIIDRNALVVFGNPQPADGVLNIGEDISISFSSEVDPSSIAPGDNVYLMTMDDSAKINTIVSSYENTVILSPEHSLENYENRTLKAHVAGVSDIHGNSLRMAMEWTFRVNYNPIFWSVANVEHTVYQGVEASFSEKLLNAGGEASSFTITDYPQWLSPSPLNGSIPAGGEQQVMIGVNTQLNVGTYHDTVFVTTEEGIEYLLVKLIVLNEPPEWELDPSVFAYNMELTVQPAFDDGISADIYDIVSVYIDGELRGVANVSYVEAVQKFIAFLTVYSHESDGGDLVFRLWDASAGQEHALLESGYSFSSNSSMGTVASPLIIEPDAAVHSIEVNQGWSWFSINVGSGPMPVDEALESLVPSNGDLIKGHQHYSIYDEELGWIGPLKTIEAGKTYKIFQHQPGMLRLTGAAVDLARHEIEIYPGWNWIGYSGQQILDINDALDAYNAQEGDRIKSQTEFAEYLPDVDSWEGSLTHMAPGQGYMLKSIDGGSIHYPFLGKRAVTFEEQPDWVCDYFAYEHSMSITAVVEFDERELADSTLILAAFSGNSCRGMTRLEHIEQLDRYVAFLAVYSNKASGDSIHFMVYEPSSGKVRDVDQRIAVSGDDIMGDIETPLVLTAMPIGDELVPYVYYLNQNYPNPFNPETVIEYGLPRDGKVTLDIFNTLGQKVFTIVNEQQRARRYKVTFNAQDAGLASGIYIYQLKAGNQIKRHKFIFIK